MNVQEFGEAYRNKTDKELLRLALTPEELTPEANVALKSELARRRIDSGAHLDTARQDEKERKAENDRSLVPSASFRILALAVCGLEGAAASTIPKPVWSDSRQRCS